MKNMTRRSFIGFAIAGLVGTAVTSHAQEWPVRPIRLIISQPPGATPDILARLLSEKIGKTLGQPIVVENRPGASNIIGAQAGAKAAPDGYTFFLATAAALAANPYTFKSLPYDPLKDFAPVGMVGGNYFMVLVNNAVPAKTFDEYLALAKAQPDKMSFASDGAKGFAGLLGDWISKRAGTKTLHVPYTSAAQSLQETIAGRNQMTIQATPTAMPFIARGAVRPLAISSPTRAKGFENLPTISQTLPGVELLGWLAVVAPIGVPTPVIEKFNVALNQALNEPAIQQRLQEFGMSSEGSGTPEELKKYILAEHARWANITKELGVIAD
jgi:tripartite-type tricarboxylate transporter receptor subunit TctC